MKYINLKTLTKLIERTNISGLPSRHFLIVEWFNFRYTFCLGQILKYHSTNSEIHGF